MKLKENDIYFHTFPDSSRSKFDGFKSPWQKTTASFIDYVQVSWLR